MSKYSPRDSKTLQTSKRWLLWQEWLLWKPALSTIDLNLSLFRMTVTTQLCITRTTRWWKSFSKSIIVNISIFISIGVEVLTILVFSGCLFTSSSCPCFSTCRDASGSWWKGGSWSFSAREPPPGQLWYAVRLTLTQHSLDVLICWFLLVESNVSAIF